MRRVVVTGMGMVTPLGDGVDTNWRRLMAAESGIRAIQAFDTSDLATKIAGEVPQGDKESGLFNADLYMLPKDQRKVDKFIVFAMAAAKQAVPKSAAKPAAAKATVEPTVAKPAAAKPEAAKTAAKPAASKPEETADGS